MKDFEGRVMKDLYDSTIYDSVGNRFKLKFKSIYLLPEDLRFSTPDIIFLDYLQGLYGELPDNIITNLWNSYRTKLYEDIRTNTVRTLGIMYK